MANDFQYSYYAGTNRLRETGPFLEDMVYDGGRVLSNSKIYRRITVRGNSYVPQGEPVELRATEGVFMEPQFRAASGRNFLSTPSESPVRDSDARENLLTVITDNIGMSADTTWATVVSASDYYPFGLTMEGRNYQDSLYRYGFKGKEKDDQGEWGSTNYDYGFRIYSPKIGKFLSVDPLTGDFPFYTPYQFSANNPITSIDLDGLEAVITINSSWFKNEIEKAITTKTIEGNERASFLAFHSLTVDRPADIAGSTYVRDLYGGEDLAGTFIF